MVSCINAILLLTPRILFAMSRDGLLPQWMTSVNSGGTPAPALFVGPLVVIALVLSGTFDTLIAIASFLCVAVYIWIRRPAPAQIEAPRACRPFRVWGYPWTVLGVLMVSAGFLIGSIVGDLIHSLFTLILVAASYPVYYVAAKKRAARRSAPEIPPLSEAGAD